MKVTATWFAVIPMQVHARKILTKPHCQRKFGKRAHKARGPTKGPID